MHVLKVVEDYLDGLLLQIVIWMESCLIGTHTTSSYIYDSSYKMLLVHVKEKLLPDSTKQDFSLPTTIANRL